MVIYDQLYKTLESSIKIIDWSELATLANLTNYSHISASSLLKFRNSGDMVNFFLWVGVTAAAIKCICVIIFHLYSKGHCSQAHKIFIYMLAPLIQRVTLDLKHVRLTEHLVINVKCNLTGFSTMNFPFYKGSEILFMTSPWIHCLGPGWHLFE